MASIWKQFTIDDLTSGDCVMQFCAVFALVSVFLLLEHFLINPDV